MTDTTLQSSARFQGRVSIVTGAASGIGRATALRLLGEGAAVVACDLDAGGLDTLVASLGPGQLSRMLAAPCDVASEDQVERAVAATLERFGRLDVVVNCAGLMLFRPIEKLTGADWSRVLGVNLLGAVHFTRQAFRTMQGGAIVNLSSVHAERTSPLVAPYAAAKAAILALTRSAAIEGADRAIRVNAVVPGAIDTPMLRANPNIRSGVEVIAERDVGRPEDVAATIAFLASDEARFVTGAALPVDGGRLGRL